MAIQWPWSSCPMMNREGEALRKVSGGSTVRKAKAIATPDETRSVLSAAKVFCSRNASGVDRESAPGILNFRSLGRMDAEDCTAPGRRSGGGEPRDGLSGEALAGTDSGSPSFCRSRPLFRASTGDRPWPLRSPTSQRRRPGEKLILKQYVMMVFAAPSPGRAPACAGGSRRKSEMALDVALKAP